LNYPEAVLDGKAQLLHLSEEAEGALPAHTVCGNQIVIKHIIAISHENFVGTLNH
jgi:hypothetical protein